MGRFDRFQGSLTMLSLSDELPKHYVRSRCHLTRAVANGCSQRRLAKRLKKAQRVAYWRGNEMNLEALKEAIRRELPEILRLDPDFRSAIMEITRNEYAGRKDTEDWFRETFDEMRRDREEQARKWEEHLDQERRYREEQARKWEEHLDQERRYREEQARKWDEHLDQERRYQEEQARKWDEHLDQERRYQDEQTRQWNAHHRQNDEEFKRVHEAIMAMAKRHDRAIGALGARWGMQSERSFRNALAGILEKNFGIEVLHVNEYDEQGVVFGRPDQIELDVIITDGLLLICELKSSIDKAGMHIFERKARYYESRHQRKADRLIVISPMIDPKAQKLAGRLNIETYSDSEEVDLESGPTVA